MQNTKLNRAQRRAMQSKRPANYVNWSRRARKAKKSDSQRQIRPLTTTPQIAAPIRATRYTGLT